MIRGLSLERPLLYFLDSEAPCPSYSQFATCQLLNLLRTYHLNLENLVLFTSYASFSAEFLKWLLKLAYIHSSLQS